MGGPRVAIVGCGLMGRWHAHYAGRAGARVVALVDARASRVEALARRHRRASHYDALAACLRAEAPEVVHLCTPVESHWELVSDALAAGAHVLCEKPLASDVEETEALISTAERAGRQLAPVHQFPFQRGMARLVALLPRLGTPGEVRVRIFSAGAEGRAGPQRRGVLLEILPHVTSLLGAVGVGEACGLALEVQRFDADQLALVGRQGPTRIDVLVDLNARPTRNELEVVGPGGSVLVDLFHGYAVSDRASTGRLSKLLRPLRLSWRQLGASGTNLAARALRREPAYPGLPELVERFYRAAQEGGRPAIAPAEMREAAALMARVRAASPS